jgi:hypothetical protein
MIKEFCRKVQHFPLLSVLCGKNSTEHNIRGLLKEASIPFHPTSGPIEKAPRSL